MFEFKITRRDRSSAARNGIFSTLHGQFRTPVFMPVGTYAAVKTLSPDELKKVGAEIILANTFHLHLRPGEERIAKFGGLPEFTSWKGPMLTDSGGFQVFSLAKFRKIYDDRVEFRAPLDGRKCIFTPKKVLEIQKKLGASIAMQLDECAPGDASKKVAEAALDRTSRWAEESVKIWQKYREKQALFPIVQGASFSDLRKKSAEFVAGLPTPGCAIGGLAVGETRAQFLAALETVCPILPTSKPRYLMGAGEPRDIVAAVGRGVDMFDCVLPTRLARHGGAWLRGRKGGYRRINLSNAKFANKKGSLDPNCDCPACRDFSIGYLHHLVRTDEALGKRLLSLHNLRFLFRLLDEIRNAIQKNTFQQLAREFGQRI